jgi:4-hydroxy-3-methylbut-2-en-1-yl diphosphate reductase
VNKYAWGYFFIVFTLLCKVNGIKKESKMRVIKARAMGMCFGVRDAIASAIEAMHPEDITIYGELVHNQEVQKQVAARGIVSMPEGKRELPSTSHVLITAHGISGRERLRLEAANKQLVDTTCPLVRHVQQSASALEVEGYFVIVIGKMGHVEVRGIIGDLEHFSVVERLADVRSYNQPRLGIVCQSTTAPLDADLIIRQIRAKNPGKEIKYQPTICKPTRQRQKAVLELLERVDAMVVVGGKNSNNTRQLAHLATDRGVPALHIQATGDLDYSWLRRFKVVGLTAGTSTLDHTIEEVHARLLRVGAIPRRHYSAEHSRVAL